MAPIVLEGHTLGQKHHFYNKLVNKTHCVSLETVIIDYEENDIDNLFRIDVASDNRNVTYILNVLKCEDMLYVSRAIKRCTWLIIDPQYAHIINPDFLHTQLFPKMIVKASNKFLLRVRLELKDEKRVDEFYNYFRLQNLSTALKWLPKCSLSIIEQAVVDYGNDMDPPLIKRLCEKSTTVLELFVRNSKKYKKEYMNITKFLMKRDLQKYLDIAETLSEHEFPELGVKGTRIIMKSCKERVLRDFERYARDLNFEVVANRLNKDDILTFLLKWAKNEKIRNLITLESISSFIKRIPEKRRFQFVKEIFIDKIFLNNDKIEHEDAEAMALLSKSVDTWENDIHSWYKFAPFEIAFADVKKLIRTESANDARNAMFETLLTSANGNLLHIHELLQYYHDKHINEPFHVKSKFITKIITNTNIHRYDENTWNILNKLFYSMEVYIKSDKNVQTCIESVIVYKIIHKEEIPDIIKCKFAFNNLIVWRKKLTTDEQELIFNYLLSIINEEIYKSKMSEDRSERWVSKTAKWLNRALMLLKDWEKEVTEYPCLLEAINKISEVNRQNELTLNLAFLYHVKKTWRKYMFESSLLLHPSEEVCMNALKFNPDLLKQYEKELDAICINDSASLTRFLSKLRIYWPQSLAGKIKTKYLSHLTHNGGHKALIRGLFTIMSKSELQNLLKKYAPEDNKVNWSEADELILSLRKQIAKSMHIARPLPSPDIVLHYAIGDYLQYALPSLNSIFVNLNSPVIRKYLPNLLNAPVSLQKHGIRFANKKLETDELIQIFGNIWKSSKNASIRVVLFKLTFQRLCKEKQETTIQKLWNLLNSFIDSLTSEENKIIYHILTNVKETPYSVRGEFCMKGYLYLKSLPPKAKCDIMIRRIRESMKDVMELLEPAFVEKILDEFVENIFLKKSIGYFETDFVHIMSCYLLCVKKKETELGRYNFFLKVLTERIFDSWNTLHEKKYCVRNNLGLVFKNICSNFHVYVVQKRMMIPVDLFTIVLEKIQNSLNVRENYKILRIWKFATTFVRLLEKNKNVLSKIEVEDISNINIGSDYSKWKEFYIAPVAEFANIVVEHLKEDIVLNGSSVFILFQEALETFFRHFNLFDVIVYDLCKLMLQIDNTLEVYLTVLRSLPQYVSESNLSVLKSLHKIILSHPSEIVQIHYYNINKNPIDIEE